MRDLAGQRVLVLGLGRSGRSAVGFLAERGATIVAADEREPAQLGDLEALSGLAELRVVRRDRRVIAGQVKSLRPVEGSHRLQRRLGDAHPVVCRPRLLVVEVETDERAAIVHQRHERVGECLQ